jgi:hypothetical protein
MTMHPASTHREGLRAARLLMVLSSISPLFILWAIRGNSLIPDPNPELAISRRMNLQSADFWSYNQPQSWLPN